MFILTEELTMSNFKTKSDRLTAYALACGYVEEHETNNKRVTLYAEFSLYAVRGYDFNTGTRLFWENFERLVDARKFYDKMLKSL